MPIDLPAELVKEYALAAGASVVGIAAAKDFVAAPAGFHPTDAFPGCVSVIVLGLPMPKEAILSNDTIGFIDLRNAVNKQLSDIAKAVAKKIKAAGSKTKEISGMSGKWVDGFTHGPISLKHAAELAGLGVIGKNYLLNNPTYGNILWLGAIFTDAELAPDPRLAYTICDDCNLCTEACPTHALDTPGTVDKKACSGTMFKQVSKKWEIVCFQCRKVCPHCFGTQ